MTNLRIVSLIWYISILFSYLMVAGAIDWNICSEVLRMTKGQTFQSSAPETIK